MDSYKVVDDGFHCVRKRHICSVLVGEEGVSSIFRDFEGIEEGTEWGPREK